MLPHKQAHGIAAITAGAGAVGDKLLPALAPLAVPEASAQATAIVEVEAESTVP